MAYHVFTGALLGAQCHGILHGDPTSDLTQSLDGDPQKDLDLCGPNFELMQYMKLLGWRVHRG